MRDRSVHLDLAGEHDLLDLARPDPLDRAGDRRLVVRWRHRADDLVRAGGRRIEQRQRPGIKLGEPPRDPVEQAVGGVVWGDLHVDRQPRLAAAPSERELGHDQRTGRESVPSGRPAAFGAEGEAADRDEA